jgi:hypothetical protein
MVLDGGGRLSAICIEYVCILHLKGPVALGQASFGRKAEEAQHQTGSGKRRICHQMSCFVEQLSFQNKENEEAADGIMRWGRGDGERSGSAYLSNMGVSVKVSARCQCWLHGVLFGRFESGRIGARLSESEADAAESHFTGSCCVSHQLKDNLLLEAQVNEGGKGSKIGQR